MKKPVIGVLSLVDTQRDSYWMLPGYLDGVTAAGGLPLMLTPTEDPEEIAQLAGLCDGFLFTGGQDVTPEVYGQEKTPLCKECVPIRDRMEVCLLKEALAADKPLLGICRGIQILNAALGGTLYQDLPAQFPSSVEHHQSPPYWQPVHEVKVAAGSPLHRLLCKERLQVNSCHNQGVRTLAPGLSAMAWAPDGLVEAVWRPASRFVWAVQWHPEFLCEADDPDSRALFRALVEAC